MGIFANQNSAEYPSHGRQKHRLHTESKLVSHVKTTVTASLITRAESGAVI